MSYLQEDFPLIATQAIAPGIFDFTIHCPSLVALAQPGQFVHVRVPGYSLRRPISICALDRDAGNLRMVFGVRGEGTEQLSHARPGDTLNLLGPLGNGFALLEQKQPVIAVGGGIGVPPMLELARQYGKRCTAIVGFRTASAAILERDFLATGADFRLCTDDGSLGAKGFVSDLLRARLRVEPAAIIYACGPTPMLKAVAALAAEHGIRCQVSLEERMACGVGACLGCACKVQDERGNEIHKHVCKDGPIFEAQEVVF